MLFFTDNNATSTNDPSEGQNGNMSEIGSKSNQHAIIVGSIVGVLGAISIMVNIAIMVGFVR